jgi:cyanophycinase
MAERENGTHTAEYEVRDADGARSAAAGEAAPCCRRRSDATGTLVLIGGACTAAGSALGTFMDLAQARDDGRIVGITSASSDPVDSAHFWKGEFATGGAHNVEIPIIDRRQRAHDERVADMVRGAQGIFLGGGDQVQLVSLLGGSRVATAIREAYNAGAVVCGTSAGAAALTETILAYGETDENGERRDMYMGPGLGLLGFHAMIDTHFAARRRLHRLFTAIGRSPELLGLGIDEDTALVVRGHLGRVVGPGGVTFVDGRSVRFDNAEDPRRGGAEVTMSYLRVGIVGDGYELNLRERELETVVQARASDEATPTV